MGTHPAATPAHEERVDGGDDPAVPRPAPPADGGAEGGAEGAEETEPGHDKGEEAPSGELGKRRRRRSSAVSVDISQFDDFYGVTDRTKQDHSVAPELNSVVSTAERKRSMSAEAVPCKAWDGFFGGQAATAHMS